MHEVDLSIDLAGIHLSNPVIAASGTFGYGEEFERFADLRRIGGISVKGTSAHPIDGNLPPRLFPTASGMLNSIGLENVGVDARSEERRVGKECRYRWTPEHSSRRRHTRCLSDWSSDVCSSDLRKWYVRIWRGVRAVCGSPPHWWHLGQRDIRPSDRRQFASTSVSHSVRYAELHRTGKCRCRRKIGRASCRERV